ncbi:hypothetical protein LCGC14_2040080 [marine sediment metagenome]|uniref:Uncharacterized protein n=1 Tax=marine sediment metagenome TaxID=412755 RepID=A0A0F9ESD3_9ZZZZ
MSKMGQELEDRLDANKYEMYEALKGMMEIAELAMPVTYFWSDSRVGATRKVLAKIEGDK